ncbi:unnamed protein product [Prorocentrum cordatum]|uniref:Uncharacterized protein n=1 Tax=Prorocentrum cordatum TaxID=2364126 RepID=A0ABN9SLX0_9DINO|nr:unnamed protein product [Polarella glacialis]
MDLFPQRSQRHAMRRRALPGRRGRRRPLAHGWRPCANLAALARQREGEGKAGRKGGREKAREGVREGGRKRLGPAPRAKTAADCSRNHNKKQAEARGRGARARSPPPAWAEGGGCVQEGRRLTWAWSRG